MNSFQNNNTDHNWKNADENDRVEYPVPMDLGIAIDEKQIPSIAPRDTRLLY